MSLCAAALSSCVVTSKHIVPDMPHDAYWRQRAQQSALAARSNNAALHPHTTAGTPTNTAAPTQQPLTTPVATPPPTPKPGNTRITQTTPAQPTPVAPPKPTPAKQTTATTAKPTVTPTTATTPTTPVTPPAVPTPTTPELPPVTQPEPTTDLSKITNENGHIPYAKPVPNDPTRVYNPLAPNKTIRILDKKTGKPYPSGTTLKVKGTNFQFKIP